MNDELRLSNRRQCETPEMLAMPVLGQHGGGCGGVFLVLAFVGVLFWAVFAVGVSTIVGWVLA